jgi:hypothetical protein
MIQMAGSQNETSWPERIFSTLNHLITGRLVLALRNILDFWELAEELRSKLGYHGMYEVLDYEATLEMMDAQGEKAKLTRHEVIRFLQDNVVAIHDHAWGEGELFAEYHCQPGVPVDFYQDGSKHNILISLRETKNRGDVIHLWVERVIKNGFLQQDEWLETETDHWTEHLKLAVIFPQERPCQRATLTQRSRNETIALDGRHFFLLSDGRQQLTWETNHPKLNDLYTVKWHW